MNDKKDKPEVDPFPRELYFHHEHTWIKLEKYELGHRMRVGVDDIFIQDVGKINILDLPNEGDEICQDEICGVIRGEKSRKELFAPISGEILDVNLELHQAPDVIQTDPYGIGWLLLIDPSEPDEELGYLISGEDAKDWWDRELDLRRKKAMIALKSQNTS